MRLERWLYTLPLKWRSLFSRDDVERDLDEEIRYHIEQQADELAAKGVDRDEAIRQVRRAFGGIEIAKEHCRDARGVSSVETLLQDVTLRRARVAPPAGLCSHRDRHARAGDRRQHRGLQPRGWHSVRAAAVRRSR